MTDTEQFRFATPLHVGELHAEVSGSRLLIELTYREGPILVTKVEARELHAWLGTVLT